MNKNTIIIVLFLFDIILMFYNLKSLKKYKIDHAVPEKEVNTHIIRWIVLIFGAYLLYIIFSEFIIVGIGYLLVEIDFFLLIRKYSKKNIQP